MKRRHASRIIAETHPPVQTGRAVWVGVKKEKIVVLLNRKSQSDSRAREKVSVGVSWPSRGDASAGRIGYLSRHRWAFRGDWTCGMS